MFKLYEMYTRKFLDQSEREGDIIDTIGEYVKEYQDMKFMIIRIDEIDGEETYGFYKSIKGISGYIDYVEEYNKRIKEENIMELKQDMMNSIYGEEPKVKKFKKN